MNFWQTDRLFDRQIDRRTARQTSHAICKAVPEGQALSDFLTDSVKLQHRLTQQQHKCIDSLMEQQLKHSQRSRQAHLQSLSGKEAGAWVSAIPSLSKLALLLHKIFLASLMRLGCNIPATCSCCDCDKNLNVEGYHLITCKSGGGPVKTHTQLCPHGLTACLNSTCHTGASHSTDT